MTVVVYLCFSCLFVSVSLPFSKEQAKCILAAAVTVFLLDVFLLQCLLSVGYILSSLSNAHTCLLRVEHVLL